ncbi:phage tail protein [Actibacterium ureilyticum]|uniref:phage tail protein n=1 Tax=Actibacterium ureilyticum TaxID=1590614 RepID=UPI000BAB0CFD|nr:phage tail protein [Actibacterium ureilyticum]
MGDDGTSQAAPVWPKPRFHFVVSWDDVEMQFSEVSGLDAESHPVEYRAGDAPAFSKVRMPGMKQSGNLTMRRGICTRGAAIFDWFADIKMNRIKRKALTISLMDERGSPTMVWQVDNAFPVKVTGTDLKAEGNEIAVESIEIAHEGLTIVNGRGG